MAELSIDDFEEFFVQVWPGFDPFPWQSELVRQVHEQRRWPDLVDLPTGSGKTSLIDIAVFLLALDAGQPTEDRWMPRRIVLVVDRRVVVDQADERGAHLTRALASATDGIARAVTDHLCSLSGDGPALVTTVLRGGIVRDETWARRPDVPAVISSTVDQVGSRFLFRGYGLSAGMRPIHAGLLGNDVLFLLDEVHLARPFADTLIAAEGYRSWRDNGTPPLPDRWQVVQLTATPNTRPERRFPATPLDPGSHPMLSRRLLASKPARLEVVKVAKDVAKANQQLAARCVRLAHELRHIDHVRTLGVIVNRVDTARRVALQLSEASEELDVVLLTGRMRGIDRDRIFGRWRERLRIGRDRNPDDRPLVVVATQSIEAGADFDLDGIVTECASLDALRQRFGRVDRDGRLSAAGTPSRSVIVVRSSDVDVASPDAIYGHALGHTWAWLSGLHQVDFGIATLNETIDETALALLLPPHDQAPRLLPGHLDQWVQTSLRPATTEALVGRWLHGIQHDDAVDDVGIVWRADLDASLLSRAMDDSDSAEQISARIAACPPMSGESLTVTIGEFRRWAKGSGGDPLATDVTGAGVDETDDPMPRTPRSFLRWSRGRADFIRVGDVKPGDTVLVPAAEGGLSLDNWDPTSSAPVTDMALEGALALRRRAVARLSPGLLGNRPDLPDPDLLEDDTRQEQVAAVKLCLEALASEAEDATDGDPRVVFRHLVRQPFSALRLRALADHLDGSTIRRSYVVTTTTPLSPADDTDLATDDGADAVSFTAVGRVTLDAHLRGVGGWAEQLASNLGLGEELVADLRLAGRLHDLGKADSRFQRWLCGEDRRLSGEFLAKSPTPDFDWVARQKAREQSGYPRRARHELLSMAMIQDPSGLVAAAHDPELVRFLVVSHHGFGRYRFEPCIDLSPETVYFEIEGAEASASSNHGLHRLDAGVPDLFWRLVRRYGWFGLTWLEAILRLADHARSREEQEMEESALPEAMV